MMYNFQKNRRYAIVSDKISKISGEISASPLKLWQTLILCAVCSLSAALSAALGSLLFMCISASAFAFMLLHSHAAWCCLPLAAALALLFSGDLLFSIAALLFLPVGAALYFCIKHHASLAVTTAVLSVFMLLCSCALFGAVLYNAYGSVIGGAKQYLGELENTLDYFISLAASVTDESGTAFLSDNALSQMRESIIMQTPSFIIVGIELLAYGTAKLFLLLCIMFSRRSILPSVWKVRVSLPASLLFVLSYIVHIFSVNSGVVYYSAMSLMYIIMPMASISGFHAMFGRQSSFGASRPQQLKIPLIVMCVVFLIMNPFLLLCVFCFWGAFDSLRALLKERAERGGGSDL